MRTVEKDKIVTPKSPLSSKEKEHMKLVQESIDKGVYNPPKSKEETLRNSAEIALNRNCGSQSE